MSNEMIVREKHHIPPGSSLAKKMRMLLEAVTSGAESFFKSGVILQSIKDEGDWRDGGYTNFDEFCDDQQPCGFKKSQCSNLIAAARIRPLLPDFSSNGDPTARGVSWTEFTVRPLTHKDFAPADVRRIGKKIATQVKRQGKLTAEMVKGVCDEERGVERKVRKRKAQALKKASLDCNLPLATEMIQQLRVAFEMYDEEAWDEVEETNPQLIKSLIRELDLFASFMKG